MYPAGNPAVADGADALAEIGSLMLVRDAVPAAGRARAGLYGLYGPLSDVFQLI